MCADVFERMLPELIALRRDFHQYPELGYEEKRTSGIIREELSRLGFRLHPPMAKTGVVADWPGDESGPVLALRADMDALPVQEQADHEYRSKHNGVMHACGHDGHLAILLGVARWVASEKLRFPGTLRLLFQPAEEGRAGAKAMVEAGALDKPRVDAMIGMHLWQALPLGEIHLASGPVMAADDQFELVLLGKGGHGAMPHETVDAVLLGAQVVNALQSLVSRNLNPFDRAVVSVGTFHAGSNFNVIAGEAVLTGTVRCFSPAVKAMIRERFEATVAGICQSMGANYRLDYAEKYPALVNDEALTETLRDGLVNSLGTECVRPFAGTMAAEDMAYYCQKVPVCYWFLGAHNPSTGPGFPHHHPCFDFDERALWHGVRAFAVAVQHYFREIS